VYPVRFSEVRLKDGVLHLEGPWFKGRLEGYSKEGHAFLRVLVYHRPEDEEKRSWGVEGLTPLPLSLEEGRVSAQGVALELRLDPFGLAFSGLQAPLLLAGALAPVGLPEEKLRDGQEENALKEMLDGLPLGAGYTLLFEEKEGRRYYGLGERTGFLDKRGRRWTNWATDDPHHHPNADPLYQAHPFLLIKEGEEAYGLFLDETWRTVFDLAFTDPRTGLVHTDGPTFDLYLIPGPRPIDVVRAYTALMGRAPLPPLWALGYHQCRWSYPDEGTVRSVAEGFWMREIPLEALWLDLDHMEGYKVFTHDPHRFPDLARLARDLEARGVRLVVIVNPGVKKEEGYPVYEEGALRGYFVRNRKDEELWGSVWPEPAVWPDFTQKEVRDWWGGLHRFYLEQGVSGIWNDMNEPAAFKVEGRPAPGKTLPATAKHQEKWHAEVHNLYGLLMSQATFEGLRRLAPEKRPFVLTRSGFAGIQKYAWVWTGDNSSCYEHLEMSLPMLLNLGLSGVPFVGADIGGFSGDADGELLCRWTWLGAFYPFMRNHSGKGSRRQEPWAFGEKWMRCVREAIRFRYRLLPYLYTLAEEAARTGLPLLRPLFLHWPEDPLAESVHDQALLGEALLLAPALRPGQTHRLVYLPEGLWHQVFTGEAHGPGFHAAPTPLEGIPLYQKAGTAIPLTEPLPHTGGALPWRRLLWQVALGKEIRGRLYEDEGDGYAPGLGHAVASLEAVLEGGFDPVDRRLFLRLKDPALALRSKVEARLLGVKTLRKASVPWRAAEDVILELGGGEAEVWI